MCMQKRASVAPGRRTMTMRESVRLYGRPEGRRGTARRMGLVLVFAAAFIAGVRGRP